MFLELSAEDPMAVVESFGTQVFRNILPLTSRDIAAVVDGVTTDDVNRVCFKLYTNHS